MPSQTEGRLTRIIHEGVDFDVWPDDRSVHVPLEAWDREPEGQGG